MHLVIHGGCHKTATSTFQAFCRSHETELSECGIFYPPFKGQAQHSFMARDMQRGDFSGFETILRDPRATAGPDRIVLLSGEDFENCLLDIAFSTAIEQVAHDNGAESISWIFVGREPSQYVDSLYAEISKYGVVVSYGELAERAAEFGYFTLSTDLYSYSFIFDLERYADRLSRRVGGTVDVLSFEAFLSGFPGREILLRFVDPEQLDRMATENDRCRTLNARMSTLSIEKNYAESFFSVHLKSGSALSRLAAWSVVPPATLIRLVQTRRARRVAAGKFRSAGS